MSLSVIEAVIARLHAKLDAVAEAQAAGLEEQDAVFQEWIEKKYRAELEELSEAHSSAHEDHKKAARSAQNRLGFFVETRRIKGKNSDE